MTSAVAGIALKSGTIDAGGIQTSYLEAGAGDPVVMLHGSGPGVSAMANWQHNIGALSQRFRVLAPDIVGFGATKRPDGIVYSLRTWTDHVWSFLDAHHIEKAAIVGNSLGGRVALQPVTEIAAGDKRNRSPQPIDGLPDAPAKTNMIFIRKETVAQRDHSAIPTIALQKVERD